MTIPRAEAARQPVRPIALVVVVFAVVVLVGLVAWLRISPVARSSDAADQFSGPRALEVLGRLGVSRGPHPVGLNDEVRARIAGELRELGYAVEEQRGFACSEYAMCGSATNLLARLDGREPGPAVVLTAHYDSVRAGPGIADDASGVAVALEIARLLKRESPPRHPILFLLTDGEEAGSLGARVFIESGRHRDVGAVVNLEARGSAGPSLMFETSDGNAWLVAELARKLPHPVTTSLFPAIYKRLPNDTDFTLYKALGVPGVNFAFIGSPTRYHTARDTIENLSVASLQDQGDHALAMVRAFSSADPWPPPKSEDAVFFDVFSAFVVRWPAPWTMPLAVVGLCLVTLSSFRLARRGELRLRAVAAAVALVLASLVASFVLGAALNGIVESTEIVLSAWPPNETVALLVLGPAATAVWGIASAARRLGANAAWAGLWLTWSSLGVTTTALEPAASYLFVAPALLAGLAGLLWSRSVARRTASEVALHVLAFAAPAVVMSCLWTPVLTHIYTAMGTRPLQNVVLLATPLALATFPVVFALPGRRAWLWTVAGLAATGAAVASLGWSPRFGGDVVAGVPIEYVEDTTADTAAWILRMPDLLPEPFRRAGFMWKPPDDLGWALADEHWGPRKRAEKVGLPPPELTVRSRHDEGGSREIEVHLRSTRQSPWVGLIVRSERVGAISVDGVRVPEGRRPERGPWKIASVTTPPEGVVIRMHILGAEPLEVVAVEETAGLPASGQPWVDSLPGFATPAAEGNLTVVVARQTL